MSTVLLVGEPTSPDARQSASARPAPSLKGALDRVGYRVVPAADGAGAPARLGQRPPDLIVFAGNVPDMELIGLCAAMRREPIAERTPFVVVADAAGRTGRAASRMGANLVFPPSVGPTEIADRVRRLF
jgi:CheY-like chemotaxis protein